MRPRHRTLALAIVVASMSCGGNRGARLDKAGGDRDEGAGDLASASLRLVTAAEGSDTWSVDPETTTSRRTTVHAHTYGGALYGGLAYGGGAYGGAGYANWTVPQWTTVAQSRVPSYATVGGLTGAIEGTVTWLGPPPKKLASACGPLDNPTLRVGTDKAARGVLVYIEKVRVGRAVPYYTRPAAVGGSVAKRGCALVPAAQIVAPVPSSLTIHGDDTRTKLRITSTRPATPEAEAQAAAGTDARTPLTTVATTHELQEGGLVQLATTPGVTRVESEDGKLAAAWIVGVETPYYAITDDAGRYRIDELASGTYELTFWQAPVAAIAAGGTWTYSAPTVVRRRVTIGAKTTALSVALTPAR